MALTIRASGSEKISLEEFTEICNEQMDPEDEASVVAMAPWLQKLGNNKSILINHVNDYLATIADTEMSGGYTSQSFVISSLKGGYLRANIWVKSKSYAGDTSWEDSLYTYNYPHNHNFQLLTVGFWGSGYRTDIYELEMSDLLGYPGESVKLDFLENTTLPEGKVMYYRRSLDVHTQLPPEEFSISLNLMPADKSIAITEQYDFDLTSSCIRDIVGGQVEAQVSLLTMARHMGDDKTAELCGQIAATNPNHRTRLAAFRCSAELGDVETSVVWRQAADDSSLLIRQYARARLSELESPE